MVAPLGLFRTAGLGDGTCSLPAADPARPHGPLEHLGRLLHPLVPERALRLDRVRPSFTRPDAYHVLDRRHEDLAVPDASRAPSGHDRYHLLHDALIGHQNRDL